MALLAERARILIRRVAPDLIIGLLLFALAVAVGHAYVTTLHEGGLEPEFYQSEFAPAVTSACGRGYLSANLGGLPELEAFLVRRTERFDCSTLPAAIPQGPLTGPQLNWKYLMWSAALTWRLEGGVTWSGLRVLSGVFLGMTVLGAFIAFRMVAARVLATIGALVILTSPLHLRYLPHLRDYVKAPFMIALGVALAVLLTKRMTFRALSIWALAFGAVLGIATGFRNDMLIVVPAFVVAAIIAAARHEQRTMVRAGAALAAAAVGFLVTSAPMLNAYKGGGGASMSHVALLGFAPVFDTVLGIERSPLYGFGHSYNDSSVAVVVSDEAFRVMKHTAPIATYDADYDAAANLLVGSVFRTVPADLWIRGMASMRRVFELPASSPEDTEAPPMLNGRIGAFFTWRADFIRRRETWLLTAVILAFATAAAGSPGPTLALLLFAIYFAAYPAVQFHERHFFHLNVLPVLAIVYLAQAGWNSLRRFWTPPSKEFVPRDPVTLARNIAVVFGGAALALLLPLLVLRQWQSAKIETLIEQHVAAARETVPAQEHALDTGAVALELTVPAFQRAQDFPRTVQSEFLSIEIGGANCGKREVTLSLGYNPAGSAVFARDVRIVRPVGGGAVRAFVPVYFFRSEPGIDALPHTEYRFERLTMSAVDRACVTEVSRIVDASAFPLLFDVTVPPDWRSLTRHQTLR